MSNDICEDDILCQCHQIILKFYHRKKIFFWVGNELSDFFSVECCRPNTVDCL